MHAAKLSALWLCVVACGPSTEVIVVPPADTSPTSQTSTAPSPTPTSTEQAPADPPPKKAGAPTFDEDLAFLQKHGQVQLLESPGGGRVAVSAKYQGRVMTSAVESGGKSIGFVLRSFIEGGKTGTAFDNYGGEDRFWLGPEGGQYGLYFAPGKPFAFSEWQTPSGFQQGEWTIKEASKTRVVFTRAMKVKNYAGTDFEMDVERVVQLLDDKQVAARLGVSPGAGVKWVAFETVNKITNVGAKAWSKDKGLPSVWILAMYNPSPDTFVVVPFDPKAAGEVVNDRYFGKVPADRLAVYDKEGVILFKCDGEQRGKLGVGPARAREFAGSYSASSRLLTVVHYDKPKAAKDYVNSMWETQKAPYGGDVVNSYNDGPTEPGKPSLGGFYEIETSSPAAALAPKASLVHTHRTFHFVGDAAGLDPIATKTLGVTTGRIAQGITKP